MVEVAEHRPVFLHARGSEFSISIPEGSVRDPHVHGGSHFWTFPGGGRLAVGFCAVRQPVRAPSKSARMRVDAQTGLRTHTVRLKNDEVVAVVVLACGEDESALAEEVLGSFRLVERTTSEVKAGRARRSFGRRVLVALARLLSTAG
jgi:hypothetical protein